MREDEDLMGGRGGEARETEGEKNREMAPVLVFGCIGPYSLFVLSVLNVRWVKGSFDLHVRTWQMPWS